MMYNNKLAVAIKANGKVLREFNKDTVMVPFGCEYTIFIKNLNSVRAQVTIDIDGTDATEDTHLVIQPNSEVELTRFIKNGNLTSGNRFKFIERTAGIEQHRGVGVEDGLIRIEYQFERPSITSQLVYHPSKWVRKETWVQEPDYFGYYSDTLARGVSNSLTKQSVTRSLSNGMIGNIGGATASLATGPVYSSNAAAQAVNYCSTSMSDTAFSVADAAPENDAGITVPGSVSDQQFKIAAWFDVEPTKHAMVIKLIGETEEGKRVTAPITVKARPTCVTCGQAGAPSAKFCAACGTSLQIV